MDSSKNINKESPLLSICFNIFIPVLVLKNGDNWIFKTLVYFGGADSTFQKSSIINLSTNDSASAKSSSNSRVLENKCG